MLNEWRESKRDRGNYNPKAKERHKRKIPKKIGMEKFNLRTILQCYYKLA